MLLVVLWVTLSSVPHGRCRKAGEVVAVGVSTVKKKLNKPTKKQAKKIYLKIVVISSNKVEAVVCGRVVHWCSDTQSCGKHKQM